MINIIKFFDSISVFRLEFLSDIRICLILVVFHGPLGVALGGQTVLVGSETSFEYAVPFLVNYIDSNVGNPVESSHSMGIFSQYGAGFGGSFEQK